MTRGACIPLRISAQTQVLFFIARFILGMGMCLSVEKEKHRDIGKNKRERYELNILTNPFKDERVFRNS